MEMMIWWRQMCFTIATIHLIIVVVVVAGVGLDMITTLIIIIIIDIIIHLLIIHIYIINRPHRYSSIDRIVNRRSITLSIDCIANRSLRQIVETWNYDLEYSNIRTIEKIQPL